MKFFDTAPSYDLEILGLINANFSINSSGAIVPGFRFYKRSQRSEKYQHLSNRGMF